MRCSLKLRSHPYRPNNVRTSVKARSLPIASTGSGTVTLNIEGYMMSNRMTGDIGEQLAAIVGKTNVLSDPAERAFFSTDMAGSGKMTSAVVKVVSTDQLSQIAA